MHAVSDEFESEALRALMAPEDDNLSLFPEEIREDNKGKLGRKKHEKAAPPFYYGPPLEAFEESKKRQKAAFNHEHIPVFRAYIPLKEAFDKDKALQSVPRDLRYNLVDKIREDLFDLETLISMTWEADLEDKEQYLKQARTCCLDMRGRFRSLYARKYLNDNRFTQYFDLSDAVAFQLKLWLNSTRERIKKERDDRVRQGH